MTENELYAQYRKSAHIEDVRRNIRFGIVAVMPADLQQAWYELLALAESGTIKRAETHKRLWKLCTRWGVIQLQREPWAQWNAHFAARSEYTDDGYKVA